MDCNIASIANCTLVRNGGVGQVRYVGLQRLRDRDLVRLSRAIAGRNRYRQANGSAGGDNFLPMLC